jgi:hypothetical protein
MGRLAAAHSEWAAEHHLLDQGMKRIAFGGSGAHD